MKKNFNRSKMVTRILLTLFVVSIFLFPFGFIYLMNNGNPYTHYILNKKFPPYLEQRGYSDEDIIEQLVVEPKDIINKDFYHARYRVTFKDEPNLTYYYGIKKKGQLIKQFCEKEDLMDGVTTRNTEQTKHSEDKCVSMYANR